MGLWLVGANFDCVDAKHGLKCSIFSVLEWKITWFESFF